MGNRDYARGPKDKEWKDLVAKVRARDKGQCQLAKRLKLSELHLLKKSAPQALLMVTDPAHVIPVSVCRAMMYDEDNVVLLNRFSHENLDFYKSPITGLPIPKDKYHEWWARIVGPDKYRELLKRANKAYHGSESDVED